MYQFYGLRAYYSKDDSVLMFSFAYFLSVAFRGKMVVWFWFLVFLSFKTNKSFMCDAIANLKWHRPLGRYVKHLAQTLRTWV